MQKLTIFVDMDETLEHLLPAWLDYLNEKHDMHVTMDDVHDWDLRMAYPLLSAEAVYAPLYDPTLWERVTPFENAAEVIGSLMYDGHDVWVVTSSNLQTIDCKVTAIIDRFFPMIDRSHVIVVTKKQLLHGDVMIDDAPHNLEGGDYIKLLMDAPHNREYDAQGNGMARVYNWRQIYDLIQVIVKAKEAGLYVW